METNTAIKLENIEKKFAIKYTTAYGGVAKSGYKQVLKNISFDIKKGEIVGIIGKNGSGKSTLLKIISGIMDADTGNCAINGKVASILELGIGFDPELSGRDNIYSKCGLYGLSSKDVDEVIQDIIEFSELGYQIDLPLRTYSSGMKAKLAFSVIMHVKSDILILDEVLSVGDSSFNYKCKLTFNNLKKQGISILIASHNINSLEKLCDRVIWIENGVIREIGDSQIVCYRYESSTVDNYEIVLSLAESGDIKSMNRAGEMLRDGIGTEKDISKSKEMFMKASNLGYIESQINLAQMYYEEGNIDLAKNLLEKSSLSNNIKAITLLMQIDNHDVKDELLEDVKNLSNEGNLRATMMLADILYNGMLLTNDRCSAIPLYEKCANSGYSQASFILGLCYRDGVGTDKNPQKSIHYLKQAVDQGNKRAALELANTYRKGIGVEKDMSEAIKWYEQSAIMGNTKSILELGLIYRDGLGVSTDYAKSKLWMEKIANLEIAEIENNLGDIYLQGYTGNRQKKCIKWYKDAVSKGSVAAMLNLSSIYRIGSIIETDMQEYVKLLKLASELDNTAAMYELATYLLTKEGQNERDLAMQLLQKLINRGHRKAMVLYTNLYHNIPQEYDKYYNNSLKYLCESGDVVAQLKTTLNEYATRHD